MKIIIYSNSDWNLYNFRSSLIETLIKEYDVLLVCRKTGKYNYLRNYYPNLSIIEISSKNLIFSFLEEFYKFFKISKIYRPNIVLSFTHKSNLINIISSIFLKNYSISVITGLGSFFLKKKFFFLSYLIKKLYSFSNKVVFQNIYDKKIFKLKNSLLISGSGVDLNRFYLKKKFNYKKINFFLISRIIKDKGIYEYFYASNYFKIKNKNLKFHFVGDFSLDNPSKLTKKEFKILKQNSNVIWHKYKKDVNVYLNKTDCLILPSYREGLSKIILEAMSKGIPILGSRVPGIQDIIKNNHNGYLFKPQNKEDLIIAIKKFILSTNSQRKMFGKSSVDLIKKKYSNKIILKKYLQLIKNSK